MTLQCPETRAEIGAKKQCFSRSPQCTSDKVRAMDEQPHHRSIIFIRLAVGLIFLTQGILKYIDPKMGVERFTRIGFPHPGFTAHFVGTFEMVCGALVLIGLFTRIAAVPLLIIILTAIATTKIPELFRPNQGLWFMVSDARTDFAMTMCLLFLLIAGGGPWSLDRWLGGRRAGRQD
jgi:putative oxidoreductase